MSGWNACFIETRVDISQNKEKEVLVLPVEFQQSQQDVEEGIALVQFAMPHFLGMLLLHDSGILCIVSIYADGTIYPYGKFIDKVMLLLSQQVLFLQVDDVLWLAMTEHKLKALLPSHPIQSRRRKVRLYTQDEDTRVKLHACVPVGLFQELH